MVEWIDVAAADEIPLNDCKVVDVNDVMVAVFHLDDGYFAIEDICTHDGGDLSSGWLDGPEIICPRHGARFNVKTGAVTAPPAYENVHSYPVRINAGRVEIRDERWA